jgi:hypothetical protein
MFQHDSTGVKMDNIELLPEGWHPFKIMAAEEGKSKSGYPQVLTKCQSLDPRFPDSKWVWHWVTFLPKDHKGAGIPLHFLKSIGEPFEGEFTVEAANWQGKKFMGFVTVETYDGKTNNKIKQVSPFPEEAAAEDPIPF